MSGEKCAQARLEREAEQALRRSISAVRQVAQASAFREKTREEIRQFESLFEARGKKYMKNEYEKYEKNRAAYEAKMTAFEDKKEQLFQEIAAADKVKVQSHREKAETAQRLDQKEKEMNILLEELNSSRQEMNNCMNNIKDNLKKKMIEEEQRIVKQKERRAELSAVVKEYENRLQEDQSTPWVYEQITETLSQARDYMDEWETIADEDISRVKQRLIQLLEEGRTIEYDNLYRWEVAGRLREAFEQSGFRILETPEDYNTVGLSEIRFSHELDDSEYFAQIRTEIPMDRNINLKMLSRDDEESMTYQPDDDCGERLFDIIERARQLGLIIENISWKNPDGGGMESIYEEDQIAEEHDEEEDDILTTQERYYDDE